MINRWFHELRGHQLGTVVFCVFWEILELLQVCEGERKSHPTVGAWEATDRQEAGDTTGRERFEDSVSV